MPEFTLPDNFETWNDAVKSVMEARMSNQTPAEVDPVIWNVFEILAFELIPVINR